MANTNIPDTGRGVEPLIPVEPKNSAPDGDCAAGPSGRAADGQPMVLHVRVVTDVGGGPEKTILNTPRVLRQFGYESACAYMHPPKDPGFLALEQRAALAGARLLSVSDRGPLDWQVFKDLLRICRESRVTIWHAHDYKSDAIGLLLRRWWPMKLVTTLHGFVQATRRMRIYNYVDTRWLVPRYDEVMCVSEDLRARCIGWGVSEKHCYVIPNGIDTQDYRRTLSAVEAKGMCQARADRLLVGAVGRLSPEKGFDVLIRAIDRVVASGLPMDLWIAGEGPDRAALESLIRQLGREDCIRLLGHVADPRPFFQALDAYVLSSLSEGLPNVVLEAMALEVPVIATRVAGVPSLIDDGVSGILVQPGSPDEIVEALHRLFSDANRRTSLAIKARATIERSFSFVERIRKEAAVYDQLVGRSPPQTAPPVELTSQTS